MKTIYAFQLLSGIFNGYKYGTVIKLSSKRLENLKKEFKEINLNTEIDYYDVVKLIKEIVYDKFNAIITENEIYIKICQEIKNRLEILCETYGNFDLDFILPIWDKVLYGENI